MVLLPLLTVAFAVLAPKDDPEASPAGRGSYLGRDVARTMHWNGAPWLMRETREDEENGALLRKWLEVQPGQTVCDLGCGNGYHTLPLCEAVGAEGKVFAVDLQPEMLELLAERAEARGIANLVPIEATVDDPRLPADSVDMVLMVDVYHELSHPVRVLGAVRGALREGGRVVLVEFRAEDKGVPIKLRHKMSKAQVIREMAANGFVLREETDALPWQHAMSFGVAQPGDPRLEPRAVAEGFLAAAGGRDARILLPYLAHVVDLGPEGAETAKALTVSLAEAMRQGEAPIPPGTRAELSAGAGGKVHARLSPGSRSLEGGRDELVLGVDDAGRWQVEAWRPFAPRIREHGGRWPFVAMHTGLAGLAPDDSAELLRSLGFDGVACGPGRGAAQRTAVETLGLDLHSTYAVLDLDAPTEPQLAAIEREMDALAGSPGMVWLAIQGRDAESGAPHAALQRLAAHARTTGVEVAVYPHAGFAVATTEEALALVAPFDAQAVGVCFNLCHYLKRDERPALDALLERAAPRLLAVTLSGAQTGGTDWKALIQPLDAGDRDLGDLLGLLESVDFQGPIGLQAFGIELAPADHLARSMGAWRAAQAGR